MTMPMFRPFETTDPVVTSCPVLVEHNRHGRTSPKER